MTESTKKSLLSSLHSVLDWRFGSAALVSIAGFLFFGAEQDAFGYLLLFIALSIATIVDSKLAKDLLLISIGLTIMSLVPINTEISYSHMAIMGSAMIAIVAIPYLISRYFYKDHIIRFPWHLREKWNVEKWLYLVIVAVVGYFALPFYMINSGVYMNWPAAQTTDEVTRLFIGTNALGIWDELFFMCTVLALLRRHFPFWQANILQAVLFTSFLYELGFEAWGPYLIACFALVQGFIFKRTQSLLYIVTVHLLFDFILFLVLLHAHTREMFPIFLY